MLHPHSVPVTRCVTLARRYQCHDHGTLTKNNKTNPNLRLHNAFFIEK